MYLLYIPNESTEPNLGREGKFNRTSSPLCVCLPVLFFLVHFFGHPDRQICGRLVQKVSNKSCDVVARTFDFFSLIVFFIYRPGSSTEFLGCTITYLPLFCQNVDAHETKSCYEYPVRNSPATSDAVSFSVVAVSYQPTLAFRDRGT